MDIKLYSFWRPEPFPEEGMEKFGLISFGSFEEVVDKLSQIPNMEIIKFVTLSPRPLFRFAWRDKVILYGCLETRNQPQIFGIHAFSTIPDSTFCQLAMLMHEHFGCVILDECEQVFLKINDFKARLN